MHKFILAAVSIHLLISISAGAENRVSQNLLTQLKSSIEKSCSNKDYVDCIETTESVCRKIIGIQLNIFGHIIDSQSQAIADGEIAQTLAQIKDARKLVLEQNNIDIGKANSCGKQFLMH